jgi:hypothetical protein
MLYVLIDSLFFCMYRAHDMVQETYGGRASVPSRLPYLHHRYADCDLCSRLAPVR